MTRTADTKEKDAFSAWLDIADIPASGYRRQIEATSSERAALARRLDILAIDKLVGDFRLWRQAGDRIELEGHLAAELRQACVITLAPVMANLSEDFRRRFMGRPPRRRALAEPSGIDISLEDEDPPEILDEPRLDLAAILIEELILALDPYPRAPGAAEAERSRGEPDRAGTGAPEGDHLFEKLKKLSES